MRRLGFTYDQISSDLENVEPELHAGRLSQLMALASLSLGRSERWRRWLLFTVNEATADGLRTRTLAGMAGERAGAGRARHGSALSGATPHPARMLLTCGVFSYAGRAADTKRWR